MRTKTSSAPLQDPGYPGILQDNTRHIMNQTQLLQFLVKQTDFTCFITLSKHVNLQFRYAMNSPKIPAMNKTIQSGYPKATERYRETHQWAKGVQFPSVGASIVFLAVPGHQSLRSHHERQNPAHITLLYIYTLAIISVSPGNYDDMWMEIVN